MRGALTSASMLVCFALASASGLAARADDQVDYSPEYLGQIKRDASGQLIVVPFEAKQDKTQKVAPGRIIRVGLDQAVHTPSAAAAVAGDGDIVEIEACQYSQDTAVWTQKNLTIRSVGGRTVLLAHGASAEDKAIWIVRGGDITIEGIEFQGAKSQDNNGAGIRLERGNLTVRNCRFFYNENGILTADGDMTLRIENSEFGYNGSTDGHGDNLNVGRIASLYVTGSYFHHADRGDLIESRARETHLLYNRLTDEQGGTAGYEINLPNGGLGLVIGNIIEKSATAENPDFISFGTEGVEYPRSSLYVVHNTLLNNLPSGGNLLAKGVGYERIAVMNNIAVGAFGDLDSPSHSSDAMNGRMELRNNVQAERPAFADASHYDLRPRIGQAITRSPIASTLIDGIDLTPHSDYRHPRGLSPISKARFPGAVQESFAQ